MRAVAVLCVILAVPLSILAWAVAPTIRDNPPFAMGLLIGALVAGTAVGVLAFDAIGDGLAAWGAARGIAAGRDTPAGAARDVLDLDARMADTALTRARQRQIEIGTQAPLAPLMPAFPAAVDDADMWRVE